MKITFYRATHKNFPELNYIGKCKNFIQRRTNHKFHCYHTENKNYNKPLYKFIRENNINFDEIEWEILLECEIINEQDKNIEKEFINKYDSYNNGFNMYLPRPIQTFEKK